MHAWLIDAYQSKNKIVLWFKTPDEELRHEYEYTCALFVEDSALVRALLQKHRVAFVCCTKKDCMLQTRHVLQIQLEPLQFTRFIRWFEGITEHRVQLYNADITPELQFLYAKGLQLFSLVDIEALRSLEQEPQVSLTISNMQVNPDQRCEANTPVTEIILDNKTFTGNEEELLRSFTKTFHRINPDVLVVDQGFVRVPYLVTRLAIYNIECNFHRWDAEPITYRGGKSFFTYGQIRYRDYAIRLHGRFLIDTHSILGHFAVEGLIELCQLSGARLQQVASRSSGAVFQMTLLRDIFRDGLLIPYKQLPLDKPMSMTEMVKADRAGHTLDPKTGFHKDVAEIDFMSMYPWIMFNRNISAEQICSDEPPFEYAPDLPIRISIARKGFVARAIKPFLDRRMYYKHNPSALNTVKAKALKTVLVSANGYLRFREFKLGLARSHMALAAYARETLLDTKSLAEEQGYTVVHGIIDSLYIQREDISETDVLGFCKETEMLTGIPVSFEGIFKWVVFLNSVSDNNRPVPARYYGVYRNGSIKARGLEVRQQNSPNVVRRFQQECLNMMSACNEKTEIIELVPELARLLRTTLTNIPSMKPEWLVCKIRISKDDYQKDIPQRQILQQLHQQGIKLQPGQLILYIHTTSGAILPTSYTGNVNLERYEELLLRALYILIQPFGFSREQLAEHIGAERQTTLADNNINEQTHV